MHLAKLRRILYPVKRQQTTLLKFCPDLPKPKNRIIIIELNTSDLNSPQSKYSLILEANNVIEIQETHCLACGSRLFKNGYNQRIVILDYGLGRSQFKLHRKRCYNCGEIKPNYSMLAPKHGNYHENYKRRARQHYMEGLMPSQILRVFKIDFDIQISKSSIVNWVNEIANTLREMLKETPVPSSGYWGYDEIHIRVSGEKMYAIDTVDLNTKFVPAAKISHSLGRDAGKKVFQEARRGKELWINGVVKDCTTNLGKLFKLYNYKHVKLQNCLTHVKWIVSAHVKAFAGLSTRSKKTVPAKWRWLLKRFYNVINSKDETDAYIKLEILRRTVERLEGKKKQHLITALKQLESWQLKIIAHQRDPRLTTTNNLLEGFHKKYLYYPSFKRNMMTPEGAQRVLDYRVFRHNFGRFPTYIKEFEAKYKKYRDILTEKSKEPS